MKKLIRKDILLEKSKKKRYLAPIWTEDIQCPRDTSQTHREIDLWPVSWVPRPSRWRSSWSMVDSHLNEDGQLLGGCQPSNRAQPQDLENQSTRCYYSHWKELNSSDQDKKCTLWNGLPPVSILVLSSMLRGSSFRLEFLGTLVKRLCGVGSRTKGPNPLHACLIGAGLGSPTDSTLSSESGTTVPTSKLLAERLIVLCPESRLESSVKYSVLIVMYDFKHYPVRCHEWHYSTYFIIPQLKTLTIF